MTGHAKRLADIAREAAADREENRRSVLAYRDLAERLCQPPIGLTRPDQWTGYVPPAHTDLGPNRSPIREALAEIVAEAAARDDARARRTA